MTNKSWSCCECRLDRSLHVRHIEDRYWSPQGVFFEAVMNACIVFCNTASSIEQERQIAEKLNIIATAASRPHSVLGKLIPPKYFWPMKTTNEDQSKVWFESHICWAATMCSTMCTAVTVVCYSHHDQCGLDFHPLLTPVFL